MRTDDILYVILVEFSKILQFFCLLLGVIMAIRGIKIGNLESGICILSAIFIACMVVFLVGEEG